LQIALGRTREIDGRDSNQRQAWIRQQMMRLSPE
jgi:hypothetical protein